MKTSEVIRGWGKILKGERPLLSIEITRECPLRCPGCYELAPQLLDRGIHVQVVTSAFRPPAANWARLRHFNLVVSIDGLQPEHDIRRAPATTIASSRTSAASRSPSTARSRAR